MGFENEPEPVHLQTRVLAPMLRNVASGPQIWPGSPISGPAALLHNMFVGNPWRGAFEAVAIA